MPGDRPYKNDLSDDRVKNRMRTVLPPEVFSEDVLAELLDNTPMDAAPLVLPAMDKPIDELLDTAYEHSGMAQEMISALADPAVRRWPTHLRKTLRIPMGDCKFFQNRIWYQDRIFAPPDDELRTQILY